MTSALSPKPRTEIGRIVRDTRKQAALTQQALAERMGLASNATISRIEDGRQPLTVELALRIADACSVARPDFMTALGELENATP